MTERIDANRGAAATRCAPALTVKFSSVQVRPDSQRKTENGPSPGGVKTATRIFVPVSRES